MSRKITICAYASTIDSPYEKQFSLRPRVYRVKFVDIGTFNFVGNRWPLYTPTKKGLAKPLYVVVGLHVIGVKVIIIIERERERESGGEYNREYNSENERERRRGHFEPWLVLNLSYHALHCFVAYPGDRTRG